MRHALTRTAALGLLGGAAATVALHRPAAAQALAPIRVGAVAADSYAAPYYALDLGIFKRAGLDADVQSFPNGASMAAAMAAGTIDAGVGDVVATANAIAHGVPFAMIAGAGMYDSAVPTTLLCVASDSPVKSAKDLTGKTVAVISIVSLSSAAVKAWLASGGVDVTAVKFVEIAFPEMAPALARGTVDAAFIAEPALSAPATQAQTRVLAKAYDAVATTFSISIAFATRDWLAKSPAGASRFVRALYDTARIANAHPEQTAPILAKYAKMDPDRIASIRRSTFATQLVPAMIAPVLDVAHRYGVVAAPLKASDLIATVV